MKKAIVITLGVIIGVTGVLAICAHLADAAKLALYVPEDEDGEDDEDIYCSARIPCPASAAGGSGRFLCADAGTVCADGCNWLRPYGFRKKRHSVLAHLASTRT